MISNEIINSHVIDKEIKAPKEGAVISSLNYR